jgi:hypothetical protein
MYDSRKCPVIMSPSWICSGGKTINQSDTELARPLDLHQVGLTRTVQTLTALNNPRYSHLFMGRM